VWGILFSQDWSDTFQHTCIWRVNISLEKKKKKKKNQPITGKRDTTVPPLNVPPWGLTVVWRVPAQLVKSQSASYDSLDSLLFAFDLKVFTHWARTENLVPTCERKCVCIILHRHVELSSSSSGSSSSGSHSSWSRSSLNSEAVW